MNRITCFILALPVLAASHAFGLQVGGVDIHGSLLTTASYSDDYNYLGETRKSWSLNNTELTLNGQYRFSNGLRVGAQVYAYELGEIDEITIDWALLDYSFNQYIGIRAGRMKYQLGLYNNVRDVDAAHTFAILPNAIYPKHQRAFASSIDGAMIYGNIGIGSAGSLDYEISYGTRPDFSDDGLLKMIGADKAGHDELYGAGLIWNTPVDGLRTAYSYHFNGPITIESTFLDPFTMTQLSSVMDMKLTFHILSVEYLLNNWKFAAEYQLNPSDMTYSSIYGTFASKTDAESYYLLASYRVNDWLELGTYYNVEYPNRDDRKGNSYANPVFGGPATPRHQAWTKDLALTARFDLTENWLIKAEVHLIDGTSRIGSASMGVPNAPVSTWSSTWNYFVIRTTYTF